MLFQDENGGLELKDPKTQEFLGAEPEEGALVMNVGDMLQRFSNSVFFSPRIYSSLLIFLVTDYFLSALHRVSIPLLDSVSDEGIPARYSIPFFVAPSSSHVIATLPKFVTAETPAKYEPVKFKDYGSIISKYQY